MSFEVSVKQNYLATIAGLAEGLALPAIFQIFSENVHKEERAKAFSYLVSGGSVGQVVASVVSFSFTSKRGCL